MNRVCFLLRSLLVVTGLAVVAQLSGCRTVQVAENTIGEFRLGELQVIAETDFQSAYQATKDALEAQGLFLTGDDRKVVEAVLTARDRSDTAVTVKIKEVAVNQTSIKIRYGITGDEARSQILYRAIAERL